MSEPKSFSVRKVLPWLLVVCLLGFVGFVAIVAYETLSGTPIFTASTPTPALRPGSAIKLAQSGNDSVTVWNVGDNCIVGNALGQIPSGSDAVTMEDACYHLEEQSYYYRVKLANESIGWVRADNVVPADQYKPPTATSTPRPTSAPKPLSTPRSSGAVRGWLCDFDKTGRIRLWTAASMKATVKDVVDTCVSCCVDVMMYERELVNGIYFYRISVGPQSGWVDLDYYYRSKPRWSTN